MKIQLLSATLFIASLNATSTLAAERNFGDAISDTETQQTLLKKVRNDSGEISLDRLLGNSKAQRNNVSDTLLNPTRNTESQNIVLAED